MLEPDPTAINGGAWLWWSNLVDSTSEEFESINEKLDDPIIQVNHPMDGLASLAGWSPGLVQRGEYWCDAFHAVEVMNGGDHGEAVEFWMDLLVRGLVSSPVGVSDSHGYIGSSGLSLTWLGVDTGDPASLEPSQVEDALREGRTIASLGPFLDMSISPGSTISVPATLEVEVLAPSWIVVEQLHLLENGAVVQSVDGSEASFELDPDDDAVYLVEATSNTSMSPLSGYLPWAISGPLLFDVDADGWQAPEPALEVHY